MSSQIVNKAIVSRKLGTLDVDIVDVDIPSKEDIASDVPSNPVLDDTVIIKAAVWASNPVDYKLLKYPFFGFKEPIGIGNDVAGEIVSVGKNVKNFKKGDRIVSFTFTSGCIYKEGAEDKKNLVGSAFTNYPAVVPLTAFKVPKDVPFEKAVVIPTVFATACSAYYHVHGLPRPILETAVAQRDSPADKRSQKKTIFVYSGGSSLGRQLIQMAAMSGYVVVTTASLKHEAELKELGANTVIDYKGEPETVIKTIIDAIKAFGYECAAITDAYGDEDSLAINAAVAQALNKENLYESKKVSLYAVPASEALSKKFADISFERCSAGSLKYPPGSDLGHYCYHEFLQPLIDDHKYIFSPKPKIAGKGMEGLKAGLALNIAGVSGEKIIVLAE